MTYCTVYMNDVGIIFKRIDGPVHAGRIRGARYSLELNSESGKNYCFNSNVH